MPKLFNLNVSFEEKERGYIELKTAFAGIKLSNVFAESAWVIASYTQNYNKNNFGEEPIIDDLPVSPDRSLSLDMDTDNSVEIEQNGDDLLIRYNTAAARGCLTYHIDGKISDCIGKVVANSDGRTYRTAMDILDIIPDLLKRNLG